MNIYCFTIMHFIVVQKTKIYENVRKNVIQTTQTIKQSIVIE